MTGNESSVVTTHEGCAVTADKDNIVTADQGSDVTADEDRIVTAALLDHAAIAALIPHSGSMCLLASVQHWDRDRIVCVATSHRDAANPLRSASGLLAPCAIEYAAQAMALHGALVGQAAGSAARPGYLASARGVTLHRLRLDDLDGDLQVEATLQAGDARQVLYAFAVSHAGAPVADGRATVVLNAPVVDSHAAVVPNAPAADSGATVAPNAPVARP